MPTIERSERESFPVVAMIKAAELEMFAAEPEINLPLIPPELTDEFQSLDCFVFGVPKLNCRRMDRADRADFQSVRGKRPVED
jgi:hypothetical protein